MGPNELDIPTLRARLAAYAMHARHDGRRITADARKAFVERFEREVDPDGVLPIAERQRRAEHAMRAHMTPAGPALGAGPSPALDELGVTADTDVRTRIVSRALDPPPLLAVKGRCRADRFSAQHWPR